MAAYALVTENFKFASLFFKSKDVMIFNGLIALGTVASQTAYNVFAFDCPCSPGRNYYYGLAAIGVPALAFFIVGIILNKRTWDLVSEFRLRKFRKLSAAAGSAVLGSILGRAVVAPLTWSVLSLLQGLAYTCALSEFTDPRTVEGFPTDQESDIMAKFPCKESLPEELQGFWPEIDRRLKYESQLVGWMVLAGMSLTVLLVMCTKRCFSPLGYHQEEYWSTYRSREKDLFQRTADVHANILAAKHVKDFFGFVALGKEEKEQIAEHQEATSPICSREWNRVTGVYLYREKNGLPLYSRLNKWATYGQEDKVDALDKEMEVFIT
uniref:calcium homeostasis modulator protein 2-like n=1 Tax=Doryrhamphus excisus TaxID=161450 RepID=UPI0025AE7DB6|nr:calcium homeostasis modulator protein 2-like [Doryrhamphus excisus]XP_057933208.1 calcium homeostasis modulator protein 2-like [Doryrhamphus excisus]XP_057933209.1 calcium homeostasis modulator protein 2-like [Doryrhamphus excisus]XP_057933210.1 calcium homeostasis modulator protein 2-like [Doryrhamphus excisus]XP_057933211.1 calcium homeostasis modulator protein 2-like [Doryrhamphus excisus]